MAETPQEPNSYWLTRYLILRLLGLVYLVGFLVFLNQALPLMGTDGLLPMRLYLDDLAAHFGTVQEAMTARPSLFGWWSSNEAMALVGWLGAVLSLVVLVGYANAPIMAVLCGLYLSIVNVGGLWYGYGWEIQLVETGFLAIFLAPPLNPRPFAPQPPPT